MLERIGERIEALVRDPGGMIILVVVTGLVGAVDVGVRRVRRWWHERGLVPRGPFGPMSERQVGWVAELLTAYRAMSQVDRDALSECYDRYWRPADRRASDRAWDALRDSGRMGDEITQAFFDFGGDGPGDAWRTEGIGLALLETCSTRGVGDVLAALATWDLIAVDDFFTLTYWWTEAGQHLPGWCDYCDQLLDGDGPFAYGTVFEEPQAYGAPVLVLHRRCRWIREARAAVKRGAALMNMKWPGSVAELDPDRLDVNDTRDCPLGQLGGSYAVGLALLWPRLNDATASAGSGLLGARASQLACRYGFDVSPPVADAIDEAVNRAWREEIFYYRDRGRRQNRAVEEARGRQGGSGGSGSWWARVVGRVAGL